MKSCSDYRAQARETLDGHWNETALMALVFMAIMSLFIGISVYTAVAAEFGMMMSPQVTMMTDAFNTVASLLLTGPLEFAMLAALLLLKRNKLEESPTGAMFTCFTGNYGRYVVAMVLETIVLVLLLFPTLGIGTIIFSYAYRMVPYLLHDYPELSPREALKLSREMMRGYKWDLFVLDFSFIGWLFLAILSMGIGMFWLMPYMYTAGAHFYDDLKDERLEDSEEEVQEVQSL